MQNSQEFLPPNNGPTSSDSTQKRSLGTIKSKLDIFAFLKSEENPSKSSQSFFSENGLSQDIIQVTGAEPDICPEVFYALYDTLWPQIDSQSDVSFKDAWTRFIGGSVFKGSLCPPEKLIIERRVRDIKRTMSEPEGEVRIFHDLDQVVSSILNLKQKIDHHPEEILCKKEVIASLILAQEFYLDFRNKVKGLVQKILEKEKINVPCVSESDALEDLLEPKAIMMSDIFPHHWAYRISRNQAQKLLSLDPNGRILKSNLNDPSNHRVIALPEKTTEPLVFFKANGNPPIQPEKEFMIYSLYKHLQIPVPETALVILTNVFLENPEYFYAVQASEAVLGESSLKACQDPETTLDHEAYVSQTIGAFLTNPSDGSLKNFKYSSIYQTLVSIDNDLVFKPEIIGKDEKKVVNVKSILYLVPEIDLPIPESVKIFFSTLDPQLTIYAWLQDLSQKNREYQLLFTRLTFQKTRCIYQNLLPQSEVPLLSKSLQQKVQVDPDIHSDSFKPQILLSQTLLNNLIEKFQAIEKILSNNRAISTQLLFEEIFPALGKYYRKLRFKFSDIEEALEALWGNKKNDIDYSYISSLLDNEEILSSSTIELSENQMPDIFVKQYKDLIISGQSALDGYVRRQNQRKRKNSLNLQIALTELKLLIQEDLTNSQSPREIVDFCYTLSKMIDSNPNLRTEIISLLSNLPHPELQWLFALEKYFLRPDRKDLIASSVEVLGAFMKNRKFHLTESENKYLFDQQGDIKKKASLTGRSNVTCFPEENPEFYLKQYPEWPGYEFASTLFMRLFGVTQLPYQDLIIINSKYPTLLTQKVHGDPVIRISHNPQAFHNLDPVHTGLLIISAMLINPEDGKEDNFILSPDGRYLIPIDNDHCFLPSTFQKEGNFWNAFTVNTALQTKTLLFCLDEMYMPIPSEVKQHILSLDVDQLLTKWMTEVDKIENKLNNLIDQDQRKEFLQQGTVMRIPFYKQFIQSMHWKAHTIQNLLNAAFKITPFDLLRTVEPFAAKCYQDSFKQGSNLQTRFKAATNNLYKKAAVDGSRMSILNTRAMMEIINVSMEDLQNDVMFQRMGPVDALELLNQLNQEHNEKVIKEQEMLFELDEKKQENSWINLFGNSPGDEALKAFLENPKEGLVLKGSKLITSSKLTELFAQTPNKGTRIKFLSLPESPLLTEKEIRILAEECPNIEYLNVSGCLRLKQLLTREGEWPFLARLEAKDCLNLEKFVSYSPIKILQIQSDSEIDIFVEKSTLDVFTISKKKIKFEFSFQKGKIPEIKSQGKIVSNNDFLPHIIRGEEDIEKYFKPWGIIIHMPLILPENILRNFTNFLDLEKSNLKVQDLQKIVQLNLINLTGINLSQNEIMETSSFKHSIQGDLSKNQIGIEILTRGDWPLLEILNLSKMNITSFGVRILAKQAHWPRLKHLNLSENKIRDEGLEMLSQGNWPLLETLTLNNASISEKKFLHWILNTKWSNLNDVSFDLMRKNTANNLLRKNWHLLEELDLSKFEITQIEIEVIVKNCNWPNLKSLNLSKNKIGDEGLEILSQGNWPLLESLTLDYSKISKKKFLHWILNTKWSNLKDVSFDFLGRDTASNLLQKNWHLLEELDLSRGEITQIEIEVIVKNCNWPNLKSLNLFKNKIGDEGLEILSQGNWPLLETLNLNDTSVSKKKFLHWILNTKWSNLNDVSFDFLGRNAANNLLRKNWHLLEELYLSGGKITQNEIRIIVYKFKLPKLKHLNLSYNNINDQGLEILTQGNWPELEFLDLRKNKITAVGVATIVNQSNWPKLKSFNLSWNKINDEGLEILSQGKWPLLEILDLSWTKVTKKSILNLILNLNWPNLQELNFDDPERFGTNLLPQNWHILEKLNLCSEEITKNEIEIIVYKFKLPKLKHLNLSYNNINDQGLEILTQGNWPELESLDLQQNKTTAAGVVVNRFNWPKLKHLNLSINKINDEGLKALSKGNWPLLETLNLSWTQVTKKGLVNLLLLANYPNLNKITLPVFWNSSEEKLAESFIKKDFSQVEQLELNNCSITFNDIERIFNKYKCPKLKHLNLSNNDMTLEGVSVLALADFPFLEELHIDNIKITSEGFRSIVKQSKWQQLKHLNVSNNGIFDDEELSGFLFAEWSLLECLDMGNTKLSLKGIREIVDQSKWFHLKHLNLSNNQISNEGISVLAFADWNLLESLDLSNTVLSLEGVDTIVKKSKWPQILRHLNVSNNEIFDEGLSAFSFAEWSLLEQLNLRKTKITSQGIEILVNKIHLPNLKKLDLSENSIFDEGLKRLVSGKWPLFQHLVYYETKVTPEGHIALLENFAWSNLNHLEHSLSESFYRENSHRPEILLAVVPMEKEKPSREEPSLLATVLDTTWLNSKEIYLSINHDGLKEKFMILPRDKLDQFESIKLPLKDFSKLTSLQFLVWPFNLKRLEVTSEDDDDESLSDQRKIETIFSTKCPLLEDLVLSNTNIQSNNLKVLIHKSDWPNLKQLDVSGNKIGDEGVEILVSAKWPLLQRLDIASTDITNQGLEILIKKSNWPNLKQLDISWNEINNEGLEILASAEWLRLESLDLVGSDITTEGLENLISKSNWPNLKQLHLDVIGFNKGQLKELSYGEWPLLENFSIQTSEGIESLIVRAEWPNLKVLKIRYSQISFENLTPARWPLLESLSFAYVKITLKDVKTLVKNSSWPHLKEISLFESIKDVDERYAIRKLLSEKWPNAHVKVFP